MAQSNEQQAAAAVAQLQKIAGAVANLNVVSSLNTTAVSVAVTAADVTLTANQASARHLTTTGVLTGNRNVIVPDHWEAIVFCNNTGAFTTTFKTAAGTGIVVAQTKRAILFADGTNVVRVTADT
jgi:hypothetical protein